MQKTIIEGFRLSPQQKHLWLLQQANQSLPYVAQCAILIEGNLNSKVLTAALENVVNRHEILRTTFRCLPEMIIPLQVIAADSMLLSVHDYNLSDLAPQDQEHRVEALFNEAKKLTFDFEKGPLLHLSLINLSSHQHILLVTLPALYADTATLKNLLGEISRSYAACLHGEELAEEPLQYADFSELQNELIAEEKAELVRHSWQKQDLPALLNLKLPLEGQPSGKPEFQPQLLTQTINPSIRAEIELFVRQHNTSISVFLLACWDVLLCRLTEQSDIIVGTAYEVRAYEELEESLGLFAKYLPIHFHLEENCQFTEVLEQANKAIQEAYEWQEHFSWEQIVGATEEAALSPFCPFGFDFDQAPAVYSAADVTFSIYKRCTYIDQFKVKLSCILGDNGLITEFHYDANLYQEEDIKRLAGQFQTLLASAVNKPEAAISELEILSDVERQQLLIEFNNTETHYPQDECIHQLFEQQAARSPEKIAVICNNQQLTYAALNARANQLARHLQTLGVGPEVFVGIYMERSLEVVIGILGILKAGGAYVPLDPAYPKERLSFMAENAQVLVLLTQEGLRSDLSKHGGQVISLDTEWSLIAQQSEENLANSASSKNLAYVIYTSGSTGEPKGVMVTHANLCNYVQAISGRVGITSDDVYLHTASIAFSSSVRQFMVPMSQGATVVIATTEQRANPLVLFDVVKQQDVTVMDIVPSYWRNCSQAIASLNPEARQALLANQLRLILSASEPLMSDIPRKWSVEFGHPARLVNMYGQTETTGIIAVYDIPPDDGVKVKIVRLGPPLPNSQIYVLDRHQQPVPIGVPGELHIGGAGLARGYLNRPELTAKAFIPNPFSDEPGSRLYKTGDLVRHLPDGTIEFLGRIDYQVKIRGFRIELGEIEAVLAQHPHVSQSVVIAREDEPGDKRLVAYVVPNQEQVVTTSELRHYLKEKLPDYMVPSVFITLDALPLTPTGKVDRRALPSPDQVRQEPEKTFVAPQDELELKLTKIWEQVLGIQPIGITDNFFEIGGHSLLAVHLLSEIEKAFGKNLPLVTFLEAKTVEQLAKILRQQEGSALWRSLVMIQPGTTKPPLFFIHAVWGNVLFYQKLVRYLEIDQPFYALQAQGLDGKQPPRTSVTEMAVHYIQEIRTVQPEGPYFIGGYSFGGWVAFEIARQLHAQGQEIALLAVLDIPAPGYHKPTSVSVDGKASTLLDSTLFHLRKLLRLNIQDQLAYLQERLVWHLMAGKLSIFYRIYLHYLRRSPQDLRLLDIALANNQAAKSYVPQAYPGRLTLLRASQKAVGAEDDPQMGWGQLTAGGMEIHEIPGSHTQIMEEPKVRIVAEKLTACLKQAQTDD